MEHPIELVKHGEKTDPWQVEAITGATISSRAVTSILRESTAAAVPVIADNMDVLEKEKE
jgi:electron transport complex protein RnfG